MPERYNRPDKINIINCLVIMVITISHKGFTCPVGTAVPKPTPAGNDFRFLNLHSHMLQFITLQISKALMPS